MATHECSFLGGVHYQLLAYFSGFVVPGAQSLVFEDFQLVRRLQQRANSCKHIHIYSSPGAQRQLGRGPKTPGDSSQIHGSLTHRRKKNAAMRHMAPMIAPGSMTGSLPR